MTTKVAAYERFFLISLICYGFHSLISTVVLYSIQMYRFLHRSGGVFHIESLTTQGDFQNMEGLVLSCVKFPVEIHILESFLHMEFL